MVNGITELAMMKADVLKGLDEVKVCTHYRIGKELTNKMPYDITGSIEPVYRTMPGWDDLDRDRSFQQYVDMVQKEVGVPITLISTSPDRKDIFRGDRGGGLLGIYLEEKEAPSTAH
jgi:adenylosuccinate synthase